MRDVLQEAQAKIEEAIVEIDQEQTQLQSALASLGGRVPQQRLSKAHSTAHTGSQGKRAAKGQRRKQFLGAVGEQPGITVAQIAKKLGVAPQPLYTLARKLHSEKQITKKGTGYSVKSQ